MAQLSFLDEVDQIVDKQPFGARFEPIPLFYLCPSCRENLIHWAEYLEPWRLGPLMRSDLRCRECCRANPWRIRYKTMFDMAADSHLFRTAEELEEEGFFLDGNIYVREGE